jgi:hypothetical protein
MPHCLDYSVSSQDSSGLRSCEPHGVYAEVIGGWHDRTSPLRLRRPVQPAYGGVDGSIQAA